MSYLGAYVRHLIPIRGNGSLEMSHALQATTHENENAQKRCVDPPLPNSDAALCFVTGDVTFPFFLFSPLNHFSPASRPLAVRTDLCVVTDVTRR